MRYVTSIERLTHEFGMQVEMQTGYEMGFVIGEGIALRRMLTRRFGPLPLDVLDCISRAELRQLDTWIDRSIDAASLDEVFADDY